MNNILKKKKNIKYYNIIRTSHKQLTSDPLTDQGLASNLLKSATAIAKP